MFEAFPQTIQTISDWGWQQFKPYANYLRNYTLNERNIHQWLAYETQFFALIDEWRTRLSIQLDGDTGHTATQQALERFNRKIQPQLDLLQRDLIQKLLASDLRPPNYEVPMRHLRASLSNLDTSAEIKQEIHHLRVTYQQLVSTQTALWDNEERTLPQLMGAMNTPNRTVRQHIYHIIQQRYAEDKLHFDSIWSELLSLRKQMMRRANVQNFRDLRWRQLKRFDYTPRDVIAFCGAIERVVVPVMQQRHEQHRQRLGMETLRPFDIYYDPMAKDLTPYQSTSELLTKAERLITKIDVQFGKYFQMMRRENLLDVENRPRKSPTSYATPLPHSKRPFVFMYKTGGHDDVVNLMHEAGHAFHIFESAKWPYLHQRRATDEMNEMAAMTLELLAMAHYDVFYPDAAARAYARGQQLESALHYWIDSAMRAAFQHWVYSHHDAAMDAASCDAKWRELLLRYYPGLDLRGFEQQMLIHWWHDYRTFFMPFYAIEYAIAQLGAIQIWQASQKNHANAMQKFRAGLALGNIRSLPRLYHATGATFAFDEATLQRAVATIEQELMMQETKL